MKRGDSEDFKWLCLGWVFRLKRMKKFGVLFAQLVLTASLIIAAEVEQRTIRTDTEKFVLSVPKEWPAFETHQSPHAPPYYRLGPASTNYSIQLYFNDPSQTGTNTLLDNRLERFLEVSLAPVLKVSVEDKVPTHRFGRQKDGAYARLTDRAPKPEEYRYYTRGVRLIGTNVLVFGLVSNDSNFSALSNTLAVVESVKIVEGKEAVK